MLNSKKEKGLFFLVTTSSGCLFSWPPSNTNIHLFIKSLFSNPSSYSFIFLPLPTLCCQYLCVSGEFSTPHLLNCHLDTFFEACAFQRTKNFQHWVANSFITFYYNRSWAGGTRIHCVMIIATRTCQYQSNSKVCIRTSPAFSDWINIHDWWWAKETCFLPKVLLPNEYIYMFGYYNYYYLSSSCSM